MVRSTTPSIDETTTLTGPWTKGKILGPGAVGTVFLAQLHDGRQAACKQIATEGLKGDDLKAIKGNHADSVLTSPKPHAVHRHRVRECAPHINYPYSWNSRRAVPSDNS